MVQRRATGWALVVVLAASTVLSGCGSGSVSGNGNESQKPAEASKSEKYEITVLRPGANAGIPQDDFEKKALDEKLNIDLKLNLAQGDDLNNKMSTAAAANNLPDIMITTNRNQFQQFAQNGLLLDLTPYEAKLADLKKLVHEEGFTKGKVNGKIYTIVRNPNATIPSYWIRKDWLDKLGLKMPTNPEQLFQVAAAFTEKDPDGNGKKDTFGLTGELGEIFAPIFGAYGSSGFGGSYLKNGKLTDSLYDPSTIKGIEMVSKFVTANVVDPEFTTNKSAQAQDKAFKGQAGIYYGQWASLMKDNWVKEWKTVNPNAEWTLVPPFQGTPANYVRVADEAVTSGYIMLPKRLEKEPGKLQRIIDLLNYVSVGEGSMLVQYGLKDVHYKLEGDKIVMTDRADEANYNFLYQLTGRQEQQYLTAKFAGQSKWINEQLAMPELKTYDGYFDPIPGVNMADVNRFVKEESIKFYYGKNTTADYSKFLDTLEKTYNYKTVVAEHEKQAKALGLVK